MELDSQELKEIYTIMVRCRAFQDGAVAEFKKGNVFHPVHSATGLEAVAAGVCAMLGENDYILSTHRCHGHFVAKGARLDRMMAELFGKETGYCKGRGGEMHNAFTLELNILGATGIVGAGVPIACGVGLSCKMQKLDRVCACFFGDGATATGAFHEGVGLSAVWDLPVIFVCENNQYQNYTPLRERTKLKQLSDMAKAYAISGVTVDGNDAVAVAQETAKAIKRAKEGRGPTLLEAVTYGVEGGTIGIDGVAWRTEEEVEEWKKRDPIDRLRTKLLTEKIMTETEAEEIKVSAIREVDEAVKFAVESPQPNPEDALRGVYYERE